MNDLPLFATQLWYKMRCITSDVVGLLIAIDGPAWSWPMTDLTDILPRGSWWLRFFTRLLQVPSSTSLRWFDWNVNRDARYSPLWQWFRLTLLCLLFDLFNFFFFLLFYFFSLLSPSYFCWCYFVVVLALMLAWASASAWALALTLANSRLFININANDLPSKLLSSGIQRMSK